MASKKPGLKQIRRRLSVTSDNAYIEGLQDLDVNDKEASKSGNTVGIVTDYAGVSKKGYAPYNPRKKNQDALIMHENSDGSIMFGVFDGHGEAGDKVSGFFEKRFANAIFGDAKFPDVDESVWSKHYLGLEAQIKADSSVDTDFSGTTAVCGVITGNEIRCGNIGDSRLIVGTLDKATGKIVPKEISIDHKPERPDEKSRILKRGGRVFAVEYEDGIPGPARVWLGNMDIPGLAMSRSLGDEVAHKAGVISDPECFKFTLTPEDKFLVVASDGLWEFMENDMVCDRVSKYLYEDKKSTQQIVDALVKEAGERWMEQESVIDDTTVCVALLNIE